MCNNISRKQGGLYAVIQVSDRAQRTRSRRTLGHCEKRKQSSQNDPAYKHSACLRQGKQQAYDCIRNSKYIPYHTTPTTVQTVRTSYCEKGLAATINRKKRETPPVPAKVTGEVEAHVNSTCLRATAGGLLKMDAAPACRQNA